MEPNNASEVERLRKALEFYADPGTYEQVDLLGMCPLSTDMDGDRDIGKRARAALSSAPAAPVKDASDLHQRIMNIHNEEQMFRSLSQEKLTPWSDIQQAYKLGHRDARHAAAELVLAAAPVKDINGELLEAAQALYDRFNVVGPDDERSVAAQVRVRRAIEAAKAHGAAGEGKNT